MKSFFRSFRYLGPYRYRLAASIGCVLMIAVLWGGGMGMILPVLKVVIDPEGLHGWAWRSCVESRLNVKVFIHGVPSQVRVADEHLATIMEVVSVSRGGLADAAGVRKHDWIVGINEGGQRRLVPGDDLARELACTEDGASLTLLVYDQSTRGVREAALSPGRGDMGSILLGKIARTVPEPADLPGRFTILIWILGAALVINLLRDVVRFVQEYIVQATVRRAIMDLSFDNYNVVLRLPVTFYADHGTSDTMSRFVQDTNELARGQITLFGKTMVEPAKALGSFAVAMCVSWKMTLVVLLVGPPAFVLVRMFGKVMKRASRRALESWSDLLGMLSETLSGIRVVKTYTMESTQRSRFFKVGRSLFKQQRRIARVDAATSPAIESMAVTMGLAAAAIGGWLVLNQRMDASVFLTWLASQAGMFDPVRKLARVFNTFQSAEAAAGRIFELQDQPQEKRTSGAPPIGRHNQSLEFRNVSLRYPSASEDALKDINLTIPAGKTVAIVGPNGSGKTTLVSLVPRLLEPTRGTVLLDGKDVSKHSLRSLRRQVGFVTQDTVLFHATIGENVSFGLRRSTQQQVLEASKKAFVHEFVKDLPDGYDTMVGEHGATLSGGQKQRVTIARAILRDPAILIFDEATSQIDPDSERRIHQAMEGFIKGRTTLMIAHRLSTVTSADSIVVMDQGRIVDTGTHDELLHRCGIYERLCSTQFAPQDG